MTVPSAPEAAKTDDSDGCQATEVIGAVCQLKEATGDGAGALALDGESVEERWATRRCSGTHPWKLRRSQTLSAPSSPPLRSR